ncbi:arsenite methyltransferase-like [Saccostrea echinata]|uniref:arsenite methyltransferase-like n=1 Tax=Saccostrea echinata TaxID=191078 RepID=UPI002A822CD2|nr:arsenite methyltransferase-like [Saccostrea echinata]
MECSQVYDSVKDYYGKLLDDRNNQTCVTLGSEVSKTVREAVAAIHEEVTSKFDGCGLVIPEKLKEMKILDLGSGSGRDTFILSKLIGPEGHITGIDITEEMVAISTKFINYHRKKFGYKEANTDFVQGYIEKLREAGLKENYYDVIISNGVINLTPDKRAVLKEAYTVLKEGGEIHFRDVYADRELDCSVRKDKELWNECLSGTLYWKDLVRMAVEVGFSRPFLVSAATFVVNKEDFQRKLGDARFASVTYRLFKLPSDTDFAPAQVTYKGGIPDHEEEFKFDVKHTFKKGNAVTVTGAVAVSLKYSRFSDEFVFKPVPTDVNGTDGHKTTPDEVDLENPFDYLDKQPENGKKAEAS